MVESPRLREVNDSDWPRIGALGALQVEVHHAFDAARFFSPERLPADAYVSRVRAELAEGRAAVFVAEVAGRVTGFAFVSIEEASWKELRHEAGFVHDLVVDPAARRKGIATALLARAVAWLRSREVARVMLGTAAANTHAQALFIRAGFRPTMLEFTREIAEDGKQSTSAATN